MGDRIHPDVSRVAPLGYRRDGSAIWPIAGGDGEGEGDGGGNAATTSLTPEQIRNSPEFRALEEQNRLLARQAGSARADLERQRQASEAERQAAEAQRQADQSAAISAMLGPDGVAAWTELAELSQTDQVAAARRFQELVNRTNSGQTAASGAAPAATTEQPPAGGTEEQVAGQASTTPGTPPPPPTGVSGAAPLSPATSEVDVDALVAGLTDTYAKTVERVQNPVTRNRVTMRQRGDAFMAYLGAAYVKAGALARVGRK